MMLNLDKINSVATRLLAKAPGFALSIFTDSGAITKGIWRYKRLLEFEEDEL